MSPQGLLNSMSAANSIDPESPTVRKQRLISLRSGSRWSSNPAVLFRYTGDSRHPKHAENTVFLIPQKWCVQENCFVKLGCYGVRRSTSIHWSWPQPFSYTTWPAYTRIHLMAKPPMSISTGAVTAANFFKRDSANSRTTGINSPTKTTRIKKATPNPLPRNNWAALIFVADPDVISPKR